MPEASPESQNAIALDILCCVMVADGKASREEKNEIVRLMGQFDCTWPRKEVLLRIRQFGERVRAEGLTSVGIEFEVADRLVAFGLVSPEAFEGVTSTDLVGLGFEESIADDILSKVSSGSSEEG